MKLAVIVLSLLRDMDLYLDEWSFSLETDHYLFF